ncbi:hypothetical protein EVAR_81002_1 [Eumeta japonica]|uniref:Uncharacterized protein n=1 Tax=Eumeta variegata TaxID=151549 RepID=A0A4C1ZXV4_EUMVA|nr:hypothetical protein EVAR_81002_1 [Eumeta japonica]
MNKGNISRAKLSYCHGDLDGRQAKLGNVQARKALLWNKSGSFARRAPRGLLRCDFGSRELIREQRGSQPARKFDGRRRRVERASRGGRGLIS